MKILAFVRRRHRAQALVAALCVGLAAANVARAPSGFILAAAAAAAISRRALLLVFALALVGWWWGSARLEALDRSPLAARIGTAARTRVVVTGETRRGRF